MNQILPSKGFRNNSGYFYFNNEINKEMLQYERSFELEQIELQNVIVYTDGDWYFFIDLYTVKIMMQYTTRRRSSE